MKYSIIALLAIAGVCSAATSITASNNEGANSVPVLDNLGSPLTGFTYSIGFIPEGGLASLGDFVVVGTGGQAATATFARGIFGGFGGGGISVDLPVNPSTAEPIGRNIAVLIQDPSNATQAIVFESSRIYAAEDATLGGAAVSVPFSSSTLVLGRRVDGANGLSGPLASAAGNGGVTFAAIPEPSATLLAGFALIGGLIRRRR